MPANSSSPAGTAGRRRAAAHWPQEGGFAFVVHRRAGANLARIRSGSRSPRHHLYRGLWGDHRSPIAICAGSGCAQARPALASPPITTRCAVTTCEAPILPQHCFCSAPADIALFLASACWQRGCKTPAEAKARLAAAVAARDPARLWGTLDLDTQWSWMTAHRAGRESYDITLSNLPEGQQRERLIRRFAPAATSENAAALFAKSCLPNGGPTWPASSRQPAIARR